MVSCNIGAEFKLPNTSVIFVILPHKTRLSGPHISTRSHRAGGPGNYIRHSPFPGQAILSFGKPFVVLFHSFDFVSTSGERYERPHP